MKRIAIVSIFTCLIFLGLQGFAADAVTVVDVVVVAEGDGEAAAEGDAAGEDGAAGEAGALAAALFDGVGDCAGADVLQLAVSTRLAVSTNTVRKRTALLFKRWLKDIILPLLLIF